MSIADGQKLVFRVISPLFGKNNIYRFQASKMVSLGPVMIATVARRELPWLEAEVVEEPNFSRKLGAPRDENDLPDHYALQQERKASFIGISASITNAVPRAKEVIRAYREMPDDLKPKAIIVGGWHAGDSPEEFLEAGADVVVHGEGEAVISRLLECLRDGKSLQEIPGISYRENGRIRRNGPEFLTVPREQMDYLPVPDFGLARYARVKIFPIGRTRGCSGRCSFCRVRSEPRSISPGVFLDHIKLLISRGALRFFIVDDRSEEDLKGFQRWLTGLRDFRRERKLRKLDLTTQNRLSLGEHPGILRLMKQAGVNTVAIGYESPIEEELRAMRKPIIPSRIIEWTRAFKRSGLFVHMMLIFGYPMKEKGTLSVKEKARIFWEFVKKAKPDTLQVLIYTPILKTPDWEFLEKEGRILDISWEYFDGLHVAFKPDEGVTPEEILDGMGYIMRKFYSSRLFWRFGTISLLINLLWVGGIVVSMPFLWSLAMPFEKWRSRAAWKWPKRVFRNARKRFQGHLIILNWMKKFRQSGYLKELNRLNDKV